MADHSLVFLLDVDNTLLDNDRLKVDLSRHVEELVGSTLNADFWQIYERVRQAESYVDFLATLDAFAAEHPEAPNDQLRALVMQVPFETYLYPGALSAVAYLNSIGLAVVVSDGDPVFQPMKIERSGIAAAVDGRVIITVHKEAELPKVFDAFPAQHYVLIDDKPTILANIECAYAQEFTTVLVCQGKYARLRDVMPAPDLVVAHIADIANIPREDFI